jgi:phage protein U
LAGGLNSLQFTGGESDSLTIKGVLFPHEFGGLESLVGLRNAAEAGTPLMFVNLAGQIFGLHVIESVDEDRSLLDRNGRPMRDAYSLSLKRYSGTNDFNPMSVLIGLFS